MIYNEEDLEVLVRENNKLTKENNTMLKRMRREQVFGRIIKFVIFVALIAAPIILYYWVLQPYLMEFQQAYLELQGDMQALEQLREQTPSFMQWLVDFTQGTEPPEASQAGTSSEAAGSP